jgi:hypothetical protein
MRPAKRNSCSRGIRAHLAWPAAQYRLDLSRRIYTYAGDAEAPGGKADVLDVKGEKNFAARLFLDQKTHRPLMLTYLGRKPRVVTSMSTDGPPSEQDLEKKIKEAEATAAEVEFQVRFLDYKGVNGILLPIASQKAPKAKRMRKSNSRNSRSTRRSSRRSL